VAEEGLDAGVSLAVETMVSVKTETEVNR